nr:uncharacterized protein LOC115117209 [Oncorhynchus nerka]
MALETFTISIGFTKGNVLASVPAKGNVLTSVPAKGNVLASVPAKGNVLASVPAKGNVLASVPAKGNVLASVPAKGNVLASVPAKGTVSSQCPSQGQCSSQCPRKGNVLASVPAKGNVLASVPAKGNVLASVPAKGNVLASVPAKGNVLASVPAKGNVLASVPAKGNVLASVPAKGNVLASAAELFLLIAAFDTVNHQILLSTLSELGISGAAHAWIASYLTGRSYQVANRISACLADISVWMTDHHLKLNLGKTELLFLPGKDCPFHDLAITVDNSIVSSSQSAKNLGVILDNTLSFSNNIKAVARSCRFMLYNIRRVRPCLTQEAAQVLIQALVISRLDYCNSLLAGLPACAIKPLQLIQNAAARLVFNLPKFSHVTPLLRSLHWLPVEARIRYKTMVLAYGAVRGTAPQYLQALIRPYTQTRALRSSTSGLLASLPLRKYSSRSAQSKLFAALAPQWWNKLPHDARTAESITTFRRHLKPHLFKEYLG